MNEIPIRNVYYLLCYAWRQVDASEMVDATTLDQCTEVQDLLGSVLAAGVRRLVRRGLDRGYREVREELAGIRGKLLVGETARRALKARGRTACLSEELSHDVPHNRIVKSCLRALLQVSALRDDVRAQVRGAYLALHGITELALSRQAFRQVQLDSNRRLYRFLLSICRLIHESLLVGEELGAGQFYDFRRDEQQMWRLFEEFVIEFLRREQSDFSVNRVGRRIRWTGTSGAQKDLDKLPKMYADAILESPHRRIILDMKFYGRSLSSGSTLHSANLYQLLAYLRNRQTELPDGPRHEGMLLYPVVERRLRVDVQLEDFRLQARAIDLAQPWQQIHRDLLDLMA